MSYQALYRRYRPATLEEVKGQDHIVTTLKNQILNDRVGHAYLFTGTRGTGKTSTAKIFAKVLNCENPKNGSPCCECSMCKAIASGASMNVIEMDAASNNSVEDIRNVIEEVAYPPTEGKYKVYIIDEVHMLTNNAFNALLKTLEEPPSYVVFILATTEIHKVPTTIMSRCQRYDFHRISVETIRDRINELMSSENIDIEPKAVTYIARVADGGMRDALSLLDQCIAFHTSGTITYDQVLGILGAIDTVVFSRLFRLVANEDIHGAIALLDEIVLAGRDLEQFVQDYTWYMRNMLLLMSSEDFEDTLEITSENMVLLKEETAMVSQETLIRYIHVFSELSNQLKFINAKRVIIEIAIIRLCTPQMDTDISALNQRIDSLEKKMKNGVPVVMAAGAAAAPSTTVEKAVLPSAIPEDIKELISKWDQVKGRIGGMSGLAMNRCIPTLAENGDLLLVGDVGPDELALAQIITGERFVAEIEGIIESVIEKHVNVKTKINDSGIPADDAYANILDLKDKLAALGLEMEE